MKTEADRLREALTTAISHLACVVSFDDDSPWDDPGHCAKEGIRKVNAILALKEVRQRSVEESDSEGRALCQSGHRAVEADDRNGVQDNPAAPTI